MARSVQAENKAHYAIENTRNLLFADIIYDKQTGQPQKTTFREVVSLQIEACGDKLVILCAPNKGDKNEGEALDAIDLICALLESYGVPFITTSRNSPDSDKKDRTDRIVLKRTGPLQGVIAKIAKHIEQLEGEFEITT